MSSLEVEARSKGIRRRVLKMIYEAKDGHLGCALGIVEILSALYFDTMRGVEHGSVSDVGRDHFILSKGHAAAALYATLVESGVLSQDVADLYCQNGSMVASHATHEVPGVEVSTGSGGHGLPIGNGMALGIRRSGKKERVFVLCGDGELAEGAMWEAIAFAAHHKLNEVTLIVDMNGLQSEGQTSDILDLAPLRSKFEAFRWDVDAVDGHDTASLKIAFATETRQPHVVIARTIKGKGVPFMEGDYIWHHRPPTEEQFLLAMEMLS